LLRTIVPVRPQRSPAALISAARLDGGRWRRFPGRSRNGHPRVARHSPAIRERSAENSEVTTGNRDQLTENGDLTVDNRDRTADTPR
jgi:hypothetical protein